MNIDRESETMLRTVSIDSDLTVVVMPIFDQAAPVGDGKSWVGVLGFSSSWSAPGSVTRHDLYHPRNIG